MANNKIIDFLRSLKITYTVYNFFNKSKLHHNKKPYLKFGIKKPLYKGISSRNFSSLNANDTPWLDNEISFNEIKQKLDNTSFSEEVKTAILQWKENGYIVLNNFISHDKVLAINNEIENLLSEKKVKFTLGNKIMFANKQSKLISNLIADEKITEILSFVLGKKVLPFQTINFITGSQQHAHSDSIHMTTYPLGYLIAIWIALEDINETNGPLSYYPGSHKLPYVLNNNYERGGNVFTVGADSNYLKYEAKIEEQIRKMNLKKIIFTPKTGDILIWHANLIHGGEKILEKKSTRKSMVVHYFAEDVIKYHEITERPALLK
ncbi:MAG: phytanoyl-CoA dioxygenase family protein [Bacteroidetes bacterium]|nr:phytanoyl-CoA dioxygenase family protein [Bacteroidota bacterium]